MPVIYLASFGVTYAIYLYTYQALAALRTALKKERGNSRLYSQIIDMCYQRHPIDVNGEWNVFLTR